MEDGAAIHHFAQTVRRAAMAAAVLNSRALDNLSSVDQLLFAKFGIGDSQTPPFRCVHHAFESHATTQPDAVAVEHLNQKITYVDLDRQANCLAAQLRAAGVGPNSRVCLLAERSILLIVGILGVLKAGGAYVPLDGGIVTQSTLEYVIKDSESIVVLALRKFSHRVSEISVICLEDSICREPTEHCTKPEDMSSSHDGVYVIYTSGVCAIVYLFTCD